MGWLKLLIYNSFLDFCECLEMKNWRHKIDVLRTQHKAEIVLACQIIPMPIRERLGFEILAA